MDITIEAESAQLKVHGVYRRLYVELENINEHDLNNEDVAKHITFDTFINAHGERNIRDYIKENYEWFITNPEFKGF